MKFRSILAALWTVLLLSLFAYGGWLGAHKRLVPDTDILALLPKQERNPLLQQAFTHVVDAGQQKLIVLVGGENWEEVKLAADAYRTQLASHDELLSMMDHLSEVEQQNWFSAFDAQRASLITSDDAKALREQPASYWADIALGKLYSPFSGPKIGTWQDDPFGLFGNWMQVRAQETRVRPRDAHLYVDDGKRHYIVMPFQLHVPALAMDAQEKIMPLLDQAKQAAMSSAPAIDVISGGVILHAATAAKQANREVSVIGLGSLLGIICLMWFAFRSLKPIGLIMLSIAAGCLGAYALCALVFEKVHLLTLVFGATLIGVAQDYGIYFLCNRLRTPSSVNSSQLLKLLWPGLILTFITTLIGYAGLMLTPFPGLQQMAVFSGIGLIFAWLTVVLWFPVLIGPHTFNNIQARGNWYGAVVERWPLIGSNRKTGLVLLIAAGVVAFGLSRLSVNDDIRLLQNPSKQLIDEQIKVSRLLGLPAPTQFYLVEGESEEAVLQYEEKLKARLETLVNQKVISGYQASSNWVVSASLQKEYRQLIQEKLLAEDGALAMVAKRIDESPEWLKATHDHIEKMLNGSSSTHVEDYLKLPMSEAWRHLWLGKVDGRYASIVVLKGTSREALPALQRITNGLQGVEWVDKVDEISSVLGRYRKNMGWVILASYLAVYALLLPRYRASAWRALLPTALASMMTLALLGIVGQPLQLFHMLALMLLLGIGVDYGIFFRENPNYRDHVAWLAVGLSAVSTLLSFGLLGLSRTPALQAFGLTMSIGTLLVWLIVPCFGTREAIAEDAETT